MSRSDTTEQSLLKLAQSIVLTLQPDETTKCLTFEELFQLYLERRVRAHHKSESNAHYFYKAHGARWAKIPVDRIKQDDVQIWVDEMGARSPCAATRAWNMLSSVISWGLKRGYIFLIKNPCIDVGRFKLRSRDRYLSIDELRRLDQALQNLSKNHCELFQMCLLTGARRSNVLSMRWDEIDLEQNVWRIPSYKFKTGDAHVVPLVGKAVAILRRRATSLSSPWVFPGKRDGHHIKEPKRAWKKAVEMAGITDLRVHDLRRTIASYLAIQGESQFVIAKLLGHKDLRSTAVYARLDTNGVRDALEEVTEKWEQALAFSSPLISQKLMPGADINLPDCRHLKLLPKNSGVCVSREDQIIVEGKILTVLKRGLSTKKQFYRKIVSQIVVNKFEMDRILKEMISRGLIFPFVHDNGSRCYSIVRTNEVIDRLDANKESRSL